MLFAAIVLLMLVSPSAGVAQQAAQTQSGDKLNAYDTVSVRKNNSPTLSSSFHPSPDGLLMTNVNVKQFMLLAFGPTDPRLISGLPSWADSTRFDFVAKLDDDTLAALQKLPPAEAAEDRKRMMQTVLFDRFDLKVHLEKKDIPAYALVEAKGGSKLKEADPNMLTNPSPSYHPGSLLIGDGELSGQAIPIRRLVRGLSGTVDRQVVDQTGLTGKYDVTLKWLPDRESLNQQDSGANGSRASIFTALQEQLGLRLEPTHAEFDTIIVDHIEMPTDN
jgi:uncharacterized protein (TIGR03435 family)